MTELFPIATFRNQTKTPHSSKFFPLAFRMKANSDLLGSLIQFSRNNHLELSFLWTVSVCSVLTLPFFDEGNPSVGV